VRVTPSLDTINSLPVKADAGVEREPDIAFDGMNYVVVWSEGELGSMHTVRAARVTMQGAVLDSGIPFGKDSYFEYRPGIAFGDGRLLAVWYTYAEPFGVFARFLNNQAHPEGDAFEITTSPTGHFYEPDIAFAGGRFLVVWNEQTSYAGDEVFGQVVDSTGTLINDVIPIGVGPGYQSKPRVAGGDVFLTIWDQNGRIYGRRISVDGQLLGANFEISDTTTGDRSSADIAFGSDNCLAVWMQYNNNSYDIFGNLDTGTGIEDGTTPFAHENRTGSTIVTGSLRQLIDGKNCILYDVSGRIIGQEPIAPGVYFLVEDGRRTTKIIKVY